MKAKSKQEREQREAEKLARHNKLVGVSQDFVEKNRPELDKLDNLAANMTDEELNALNQALFEDGEAEKAEMKSPDGMAPVKYSDMPQHQHEANTARAPKDTPGEMDQMIEMGEQPFAYNFAAEAQKCAQQKAMMNGNFPPPDRTNLFRPTQMPDGSYAVTLGGNPQQRTNTYAPNGYNMGAMNGQWNYQNPQVDQTYMEIMTYLNQHPWIRWRYPQLGNIGYLRNNMCIYSVDALEKAFDDLEEERRDFILNHTFLPIFIPMLGHNVTIGWCKMFANHAPTRQLYDYWNDLYEEHKFIPAEEEYKSIIEEQERKRQEAIEEERALREEGIISEITYSTMENPIYDSRGIRYQKVHAFKVIDKATGEVVKEVKYDKRDSHGQAYIEVSKVEDDRERMKLQTFYGDINRYTNMLRYGIYLFNKAKHDNYVKWETWKQMGLSEEEMYARYEDERIDWNREQKKVERMLRTAGYSRENFLNAMKVCADSLNYFNDSRIFSHGYDFERDLRYKYLQCEDEQMIKDPQVINRIHDAYELKRQEFRDKVSYSPADPGDNAYFRYSPPKTNLDQLTLEDYQKPENQQFYTANEKKRFGGNMFIPPELSGYKGPTKLDEFKPGGGITQAMIDEMKNQRNNPQFQAAIEKLNATAEAKKQDYESKMDPSEKSTEYDGPITDENIANLF